MKFKVFFLFALFFPLFAFSKVVDVTNVEEDSDVKLTPGPRKIIVDYFLTETASWLVNKNGAELEKFKLDFQQGFTEVLTERLQKIAPTELFWGAQGVEALPDQGWLVRGEFLKVYSGSRWLRAFVGFGAGQSKLQARIYVYDLSISKTEYVLAFDTGTNAMNLYSPSGAQLAAAGAAWGGALSAMKDAAFLATKGMAWGAGVGVFTSLAMAEPFPIINADQRPGGILAGTGQYQDCAKVACEIRDILNLFADPSSRSKR